MMSGAASRKVDEQTMEEVLNSIRRIIVNEQNAAPQVARARPVIRPVAATPETSIGDDILALRSALNAIRGEMEDIQESVSSQEGQNPTVAYFAEGARLSNSTTSVLLSPQAEYSIRHSFDELASATAAPAAPEPGPEQNIEAVAEHMLRQMLREWLDANLPALVERLVRDEIKRIANRRD